MVGGGRLRANLLCPRCVPESVTSHCVVQLPALACAASRVGSNYDAMSSVVTTFRVIGGVLSFVAVGVDECHGAFGEVVALGDLPLVVDLDQHAACEPQECGRLGKTLTTSVRRLIALLTLPLTGPVLGASRVGWFSVVGAGRDGPERLGQCGGVVVPRRSILQSRRQPAGRMSVSWPVSAGANLGAGV